MGDEEGGPKVHNNFKNGYWSKDSKLDKLKDAMTDDEGYTICNHIEQHICAVIWSLSCNYRINGMLEITVEDILLAIMLNLVQKNSCQQRHC